MNKWHRNELDFGLLIISTCLFIHFSCHLNQWTIFPSLHQVYKVRVDSRRKSEPMFMPLNHGWDYFCQLLAIRPLAQTLHSLVFFSLDLRKSFLRKIPRRLCLSEPSSIFFLCFLNLGIQIVAAQNSSAGDVSENY